MARLFPLAAELLARAHQAGAEQRLPEAVDRDAGGERVLGGDQPLGEREPGGSVRRQGGEHGRGAGGDHVAGVQVVAAVLEPGDAPAARRLLGHHRHRRRLELRQFGFQLRLLRGRGDLQPRLQVPAECPVERGVPDRYGRRLVFLVRVLGGVERGVEAEVLGLRDRVVLVGVALGARRGRAHPHGKSRVHPVDHRDGAEFLVRRAALVVGERVPVERGRHPVGLRRVRQQVPGELRHRKPVEREVGVVRPDHPVAERPDGPQRVVRVPGAVGVPREVEPRPRPVLAERGFGQERVHVLVHRPGRAVRGERLGFGDRRRQAGQVEREPAGQGPPVGLGLRRQPGGFQLREDEPVDRVRAPPRRGRHGGPGRHRVRPVPGVLRPGLHPRFQRLHLLRRERLAELRRRHHLAGVRGFHPLHQRALGRLPRHDRAFERPGAGVQAQARLPAPLVRAVAGDAMVKEDRPHVAVEVDRRRGPGGRRGDQTDESGGEAHARHREVERTRQAHYCRPRGAAEQAHGSRAVGCPEPGVLPRQLSGVPSGRKPRAMRLIVFSPEGASENCLG